MSDDTKALDEIHKGACMGKDAIDYVLDKVESKKLKSELEKELGDYEFIMNEIEQIYPKYNDGNPHTSGVVTKTMTWMGVEMETLTDHSNTKIAELLLKGLNMGIIEGRKTLNNKKLKKEVHDIVSKFVNMQEESVEALKKFL